MNELLDLTSRLRSFPVSADSVQVLETPDEFYNQLIVDELATALEKNPDLSMNILIDYFRGTRGGDQHSSAALLKRLLPRASVSLFHTPSMRGWLKKMLPERSNEIVGLQHMKLYIFDDNIIISGANLSDNYFTNRQDRYILIRDCASLAEFFNSLVDAVSSCSFSLQNDGSLVVHKDCTVHPSEGSFVGYWEMIHERIFNLVKYKPAITSVVEDDVHDTRVYPLVQLGMFSIDQEHKFLSELFTIQDTSVHMTVASGYFNFVDEYAALISNVGKYSMDVVFASPQANGFHEGAGLSGYIPAMYVCIAERFFRSTRPKVKLFEYTRPNWSFHGKGLWIDSERSSYTATLVGSSNYGFRSVHRDLEAQALIVTSNEQLRARLRQEHKRLFEYSSLVEAATFLRPDHRVPFWLRMVSRYLRNFF